MSRAGYFWTSYLMLWFVGLTWAVRPSPHLIWNASASVPTGLYVLSGTDAPAPGDLVAFKPPAALSRYMALRFYLPLGLPLIKHVGALSGQIVCRHGLIISVEGRAIATAQAQDHARRPLPVWQGCHRIAADEIFLLNANVPNSFDGRYFGALPRAGLLGRAIPLWSAKDVATP